VDREVLLGADPKKSASGSVLNREIAPAVEREDLIGGGRIQARPASIHRENDATRVLGMEQLGALDPVVAPKFDNSIIEQRYLKADC
jgi:hypothetical protein